MKLSKLCIGFLLTVLLAITVSAAVDDLTVLSPNGGEFLSGNKEITWNADNGNPDLTITIRLSDDDFFMNDVTLATSLPNTGSYTWDTTGVAEGTNYKVRVQSKDSNNQLMGSDKSNEVFGVDNAAPSTMVSFIGMSFTDEDEITFLTPLTKIDLSAEDTLSGVAATYYQINDGQAVLYQDPFSLEGVVDQSVITYWSVDNAGNEEQHKSLTVTIDNSAPVTEAVEDGSNGENGWYVPLGGDMTSKVHLSCFDDGVGTTVLHWKWDTDEQFTDSNGASVDLNITIPGAHLLSFYCTDYFENKEATKSLVIKYDNGGLFYVGSPSVSLLDAPQVNLLFTNKPTGMKSFNAEQSASTALDTSLFFIGGNFFTLTSELPNGEFEVVLTFNYDDADNNGILDGTTVVEETNLNVYYYDGAAWVLVPNPTLDVNANTITVTVNHFTEFALMVKRSTVSDSNGGSGGGGSSGGGGGGSSSKKAPTTTATTTTTTATAPSAVEQETSSAPQVAAEAPAPASESTGITGAAVTDATNGAFTKAGKVAVFSLLAVIVALVVVTVIRKRK